MINLDFRLFWCGGAISYLRYLTFKTLRHFHPHSTIELFVSKKYNPHIHAWDAEKQDFENNKKNDYLDSIRGLDVKIIEMDYFGSPSFCPILQADLARFWFLYNFGGFYLDTDQIILQSFESLPLDYDLIYSQFANADRAQYSPTGVLGCCKNSDVAKAMMSLVPKGYSSNIYNSSGPFIWEYMIQSSKFSNAFNAPPEYFYPIDCSRDVGNIYDGSFVIPKESLALHWYAGHPLSQEFNQKYTEDFAKQSNDSISCFIRSIS